MLKSTTILIRDNFTRVIFQVVPMDLDLLGLVRLFSCHFQRENVLYYGTVEVATKRVNLKAIISALDLVKDNNSV